MLEAIRITKPGLRLYQATSSEIFGATTESPQNETTPFRPHTPYGVAKLYGHLMLAAYRERYGMHLSQRDRSTTTSRRAGRRSSSRARSRAPRRRSSSACRTSCASATSTRRATGASPGDFVEAMWLMLQQERGDDYVDRHRRAAARSASSSTTAFGHVGLDAEPTTSSSTPSSSARPTRCALVGDPTKARERLGWVPRDVVRRHDRRDGRGRPRAAQRGRVRLGSTPPCRSPSASSRPASTPTRRSPRRCAASARRASTASSTSSSTAARPTGRSTSSAPRTARSCSSRSRTAGCRTR